jgi:hypothetical protein
VPCLPVGRQAVYLIAAWRVLMICRLGRSDVTISCEIVFDESEWKATYRVMHPKRKLPKKPLALNEMIRLVGELGGWVATPGRKDMPGPQTTWIGLQRVRDLAWAWKMFGTEAEKYQENVYYNKCVGTFDFPATFVSPELTMVFKWPAYTVIAIRHNEVNAAFGKTTSQSVIVVTFVRNDTFWNQTHRLFFSTTIFFYHDHRPFAGLGFTDTFAPFLAELNVPSRNVSFNRNLPCSSSSASRCCWTAAKIPCSPHSIKRRRHVLQPGKFFGMYSHGQPARQNQINDSNTRRLFARGLPPSRPDFLDGKDHFDAFPIRIVKFPGDLRGAFRFWVFAMCHHDSFHERLFNLNQMFAKD